MLHPGLSGGVGVAGLDLNEHFAAGRMWRGFLTLLWALPCMWFYPALNESEPQSRGSGIWGFFCLKERSGPSKGSLLPLPPFPTLPPQTAGLGPPAGAGSLAVTLRVEGSRTCEDSLPSCGLRSPSFSPSLSSSSKHMVPIPSQAPLPLPSPFPFPLRGPHLHVELIRSPSGLVTQLLGRGPCPQPPC